MSQVEKVDRVIFWFFMNAIITAVVLISQEYDIDSVLGYFILALGIPFIGLLFISDFDKDDIYFKVYYFFNILLNFMGIILFSGSMVYYLNYSEFPYSLSEISFITPIVDLILVILLYSIFLVIGLTIFIKESSLWLKKALNKIFRLIV